MITKGSRFNKPHRMTKSALDKNLKANASSINPNTFFTMSSQDPDLGKFLTKLGNRANRANGSPNPKPKPANAGVIYFALFKFPNTNPKIGPVQEKETMAKVNAIKNIPIKSPVFDLLSNLLAKADGKEIS